MILPVIQSYSPEFIFISCGFDVLNRDPLGGFKVTKDALSVILFSL